MDEYVARFGNFDHIAGLPAISRASVRNGIAYTAGLTGRAGETASDQMRVALETLDAVLEEVGSSRSSVLFVQVWFSDPVHFEAINDVWNAWVDRDNRPARAAVEARLYRPDVLVEIQAVAAVERS